jgi:hypothetical protein
MKHSLWLVIFSITFWPIFSTVDPYSVTLAATATDTIPASSTSTSSSTNCSSSGTVYGGGSMSYCNNSNNQLDSQDDTKKLNDQGSSSATSAGMAATAAGMAMIAAGIALMANPNTAPAGAAMVAAGTALLMSGMQAMQAAQKMAGNAGISGYRGTNMGNIVKPGLSGTNLGDGSGTSGIKIDSSLLRNGKVGSIMDDFENKTGISRDDLKSQLEAGNSPAAIMAGSKKFGGASEAQLQNMLDKNSANAEPMSGQEMMDKLGLTADDLKGTGEENTYATGSGGSRSPASRSGGGGSSLDSLLGKSSDALGSGTIGGVGSDKGLSPEIQSALDRSGITNRTLFQMVHTQYKKKTPMMFGQPASTNPLTNANDNPFSNLSGAKVEL